VGVLGNHSPQPSANPSGDPDQTSGVDVYAGGAWAIAAVTIAAVAVVCLVVLDMELHAAACPTQPAAQQTACQRFIQTPQFLLWLLLLCGQAIFWVLALGPVWVTVKRHFSQLRRAGRLSKRTYIALAAALLAIAVVTAAFTFAARSLPQELHAYRVRAGLPAHWPLPHHSLRLGVLSAFALVVALGAIVGVWLTGLRLQAILSKSEDRVDASIVKTFLSLQRDLNTMLAIAGGIIGLATLATGALRNAVLVVHLKFDAYYLLLYGLYFTGVLAVAYAPSYVAMRAAGARIRDRAFPLPDPEKAAFFDVVTKRKSFDELIQLNLSASATFKAGVAIFTPLASGLIALLIPKFTQ
jgi:hypothetical protein